MINDTLCLEGMHPKNLQLHISYFLMHAKDSRVINLQQFLPNRQSCENLAQKQ